MEYEKKSHKRMRVVNKIKMTSRLASACNRDQPLFTAVASIVGVVVVAVVTISFTALYRIVWHFKIHYYILRVCV